MFRNVSKSAAEAALGQGKWKFFRLSPKQQQIWNIVLDASTSWRRRISMTFIILYVVLMILYSALSADKWPLELLLLTNYCSSKCNVPAQFFSILSYCIVSISFLPFIIQMQRHTHTIHYYRQNIFFFFFQHKRNFLPNTNLIVMNESNLFYRK